MRIVISVACVLACAFSVNAQVKATLNRLPGDATEIRIRNNSPVSLAAFGLGLHYVHGCAQNNAPLMVYVDPVIDTGVRPLPPSQERTVAPEHMVLGCFTNGKIVLRFPLFEEPIVTAGIFSDGTTTGDEVLLTRLILRRSNMLAAVEVALEILADAARHNVPRDQMIEQFKKMARSVSHSYLPTEQQVGLVLYQSIIGKLINLPDEPLGSPFPPSAFVAQETAMLNRQRVILSESQPSLTDATLIGK